METNVAKNIERAKLVKREREKRAWTQQRLAEVAEVNLRTIQRLEKDGSASFETLMAVAHAFDNMNVEMLTQASKSQEKENPAKKVHMLPRLTSGKDFAGIIAGAEQFQVEHDETDDERALNAMMGMLTGLKSEIVRWHDADLAGKLKVEIWLSQAIKELDSCGFYLFGVRREIPRIVGEQKTQILMSTIYVSHCRSPKIIRDKRSNMIIPAVLTEVAH